MILSMATKTRNVAEVKFSIRTQVFVAMDFYKTKCLKKLAAVLEEYTIVLKKYAVMIA